MLISGKIDLYVNKSIKTQEFSLEIIEKEIFVKTSKIK